MSCIKTIVELGQDIQNDGVVLADHKILEVSVIFSESEWMSLLDVKLQGRQFLGTQYPVYLEASPGASPE